LSDQKLVFLPAVNNKTLFDESRFGVAVIAHSVWRAGILTGISASTAKEKNFIFTLYDPPITKSIHLEIKLTGLLNKSEIIVLKIGDDSYEDTFLKTISSRAPCIKRIVCGIDGTTKSSTNHLAHYAQRAFPCWAALRRFPEAEKFMFSSISKNEFSWNSQLNQVFETNGIFTVPFDFRLPGAISKCDWMLSMPQPPTGFLVSADDEHKANGQTFYNHDHNIFKKVPVNYFSGASDLQVLQQIVLRKSFMGNVPERTQEIVVLVLNRKDTRRMIHGESIAVALRSSKFKDFIRVVYIPNMEGSLQKQAQIMHSANIVISPHGAQLTNLAFIRPCTVVAEIFPRGYYLNFFQHYVLAAGGISFEAYEEERNFAFDSRGLDVGAERSKRRGVNFLTSPISVLHAFPRFILEFSMCRNSLTI